MINVVCTTCNTLYVATHIFSRSCLEIKENKQNGTLHLSTGGVNYALAKAAPWNCGSTTVDDEGDCPRSSSRRWAVPPPAIGPPPLQPPVCHCQPIRFRLSVKSASQLAVFFSHKKPTSSTFSQSDQPNE
jgi:hypothetical protein